MGAKTSKTLVIEDKNTEEFSELTEEMRSASVRAAGLNALYIPLVMLASSAATAIVLVRGGDMVLEHGMLIGTLRSVHFRADSADGEGAGKHHFGAAEH